MSNSRIFRDRQAESAAALDRSGANDEWGSLAILAQTTAVSSYPTDPSSFFACRPLNVDGEESEGAAASFTPEPARTIYAFNVGSQTPPLGTRIIITDCGGRWVFRYDG
jgi:hypothetical protein